MADRKRKSASDETKSLEKKGKHPEDGNPGEDCRCKEVSKKTVPELLKVMVRDLAFWKKGK